MENDIDEPNEDEARLPVSRIPNEDELTEIVARLPISRILRSGYNLKKDDFYFHKFQFNAVAKGKINPSSVILSSALESRVVLLEACMCEDKGNLLLESKEIKLEFLNSSRIIGSCNGFLSFLQKDRTIIVFNPVKWSSLHDTKIITAYPYVANRICYAFGCSLTNHYKLLRIVLISKEFYEVTDDFYQVEVFCFSSNKWKTIAKLLATFDIIPPNSMGIVSDGTMYWLCGRNSGNFSLLSVNLSADVLRLIPIAIQSSNLGKTQSFELGELKGSLICLDGGSMENVNVWRMLKGEQGDTISWSKRVFKRPGISFGGVGFRPLLVLNEGLTLVEISGSFYSYSSKGEIEKIDVKGLPSMFKAVSYLGTLIPFGDAIRSV